MSFVNGSESNGSVALQRQGVLGLVLFGTVTTLPCCVFLFINLTMLVTLRSKAVFRDTSRYALLFGLLCADTVQLAHSQSMFLLSTLRVTLPYPVCAALTVLNHLTLSVSLITLVLMCLERYVAVCFPFRHGAFITAKTTGVAICMVWCFSAIKDITQLSLILSFHFQNVKQVQMLDFCGRESVFVDAVSETFNRAFTYFLLVLGGLTVSFSYAGIIVAARSASTDAASAGRARRTLLLHLLQMGLTLSSTVHNALLIVISTRLDRVVALRVQVVLYVCVIILPKCLSSLIYGLRDRTIRPVLLLNLTCQWRRPF
ncbi:odorant receptor 131-2 [Fundulus heteroclitus]|uniref:odorant receptor 131-2 n=1 Tax=Fundulus heteroclitus TaxID=8078 RepID=UPI00165B7BF5|nr:odorant receptor 131-2 [Fundulus heteroclitus]